MAMTVTARGLTDAQRSTQTLQQEYDAAGSVRAYAAANGIAYSTARERLERYGVTRRRPGRPKGQRKEAVHNVAD
jgi:hypothetical protein